MDKEIIYMPVVKTADVESVGIQIWKRYEKLSIELDTWKIIGAAGVLAYLILQTLLIIWYIPFNISGFEFFDITVYYIQPFIVLGVIVGVISAILAPTYPISKDAVVLFQWINYATLIYIGVLLVMIIVQFWINTTGGLVYLTLFMSGLIIEYLPSLLVSIPAYFLLKAWNEILSICTY